jgi:hypothetical protein
VHGTIAIYKTDFSVIDGLSTLELTSCDEVGVYEGEVSLIDDINTLNIPGKPMQIGIM